MRKGNIVRVGVQAAASAKGASCLQSPAALPITLLAPPPPRHTHTQPQPCMSEGTVTQHPTTTRRTDDAEALQSTIVLPLSDTEPPFTYMPPAAFCVHTGPRVSHPSHALRDPAHAHPHGVAATCGATACTAHARSHTAPATHAALPITLLAPPPPRHTHTQPQPCMSDCTVTQHPHHHAAHL